MLGMYRISRKKDINIMIAMNVYMINKIDNDKREQGLLVVISMEESIC